MISRKIFIIFLTIFKTMCVRTSVVVVLVIGLFLLVGCSGGDGQDDSRPQIANPASEKCVEDGHEHVIGTNEDGSQIGYCILENGTKCEEWRYYRGEC